VSTDPADAQMRASDADREAVAGRLREAHAEGRLSFEEFQERLDATYAARTHGELTPLTRDLPGKLPARRPERTPERRAAALRAAWATWFSAVLVCTAIWGASGLSGDGFSWHNFWPVWVAGPWGALLLARTLTAGQERERPGRRDGEVDHR
jgi:uncharacterized protein DUF1707